MYLCKNIFSMKARIKRTIFLSPANAQFLAGCKTKGYNPNKVVRLELRRHFALCLHPNRLQNGGCADCGARWEDFHLYVTATLDKTVAAKHSIVNVWLALDEGDAVALLNLTKLVNKLLTELKIKIQKIQEEKDGKKGTEKI